MKKEKVYDSTNKQNTKFQTDPFLKPIEEPAYKKPKNIYNKTKIYLGKVITSIKVSYARLYSFEKKIL